MQRGIVLAREMKMDGVVLGILREDHSVDVERTKELASLARPMEVTFHRAFDECPDIMRALENVIQTGADRILTSGGKPDVVTGAESLRELLAAAGKRIVIILNSEVGARFQRDSSADFVSSSRFRRQLRRSWNSIG